MAGVGRGAQLSGRPLGILRPRAGNPEPRVSGSRLPGQPPRGRGLRRGVRRPARGPCRAGRTGGRQRPAQGDRVVAIGVDRRHRPARPPGPSWTRARGGAPRADASVAGPAATRLGATRRGMGRGRRRGTARTRGAGAGGPAARDTLRRRPAAAADRRRPHLRRRRQRPRTVAAVRAGGGGRSARPARRRLRGPRPAGTVDRRRGDHRRGPGVAPGTLSRPASLRANAHHQRVQSGARRGSRRCAGRLAAAERVRGPALRRASVRARRARSRRGRVDRGAPRGRRRSGRRSVLHPGAEPRLSETHRGGARDGGLSTRPGPLPVARQLPVRPLSARAGRGGPSVAAGEDRSAARPGPGVHGALSGRRRRRLVAATAASRGAGDHRGSGGNVHAPGKAPGANLRLDRDRGPLHAGLRVPADHPSGARPRPPRTDQRSPRRQRLGVHPRSEHGHRVLRSRRPARPSRLSDRLHAGGARTRPPPRYQLEIAR